MARDYWFWLGGMLRGGCGEGGGSFESWLVPGWRSGRLQSTGQTAADWQIWLPLVAARTKTLEEAAVNVLALPMGESSAGARAAVYASRGPRCAYPGELIADLGEAVVTGPGVGGFSAGMPLLLPGSQLYWVATWWKFPTPAPLITTGATAEAGAYPVLAYSGPGDLFPRCGWAQEAVYGDVGVVDWPNPPDDDLFTMTIGGAITSPPTNLGLPAVFLLFS